MQIQELLQQLEAVAPAAYQESYDNAGLITGHPEWNCTGVLVSLDATEAIVDEAIRLHCNLVVAHHPIVFGGLKKINGKNYVEKAVIKAIKNDIALFAIHTNLDNVFQGVNGKIADLLGLQQRAILQPKRNNLRKLVVFVPASHEQPLLEALFAAGAGGIGDYTECSFGSEGQGSFRPGADTRPFSGQPGQRHLAAEKRLELIYPQPLERAIVTALRKAHPYEEPAFDLIPLDNEYDRVGSGMIGTLEAPLPEKAFLEQLKTVFHVPVIRHSPPTGKPISRVAVCGGAGSFLVSRALAAGADAFVTADLKYHEFFDANDRLLLADAGHFETEQFTIDLLYDILAGKFPTFAVFKTGLKTNPVNYYT
ncbi:MAG: Nif3-like dinuclear metal center hexameric protein [Flavihumibacter sp.]